MHYEINVALNGRHVFATHARSLTSTIETVDVYKRLLVAFPKKDGYSISISEWESVGHELDPNELMKEVKKNKKMV